MDTNDSFTVYKEFTYKEPADILMGLLKDEGIEYRFRNEAEVEQEVILGPETHSMVILLKPEDHLRVDDLIERRANSELDSIDKDYFIFSFDNKELREVVVKSHEWTPLDVALAIKLLKERGETVAPDEIKKERALAMEESSKPVSVGKNILILLYILAVFTSLISTVAGIIYMVSRKTNSAGVRVPKYDKATRQHGLYLVVVAQIGTIILLCMLFAD
jgi:hypothetical protein